MDIPQAIDGWGVLYTVVTLLLGGGLVKILQHVGKAKKEKREELKEDGLAFRQNLLERVKQLETKGQHNSEEILRLTGENSQLRAEVTALRSENETLRQQLNL